MGAMQPLHWIIVAVVALLLFGGKGKLSGIMGDAAKGVWPAAIPDHQRVAYDLPAIRKWLEVFLVRFFQTSQFKRSAVPNGPKVTSGGSLSPRGDWRMPSDAEATAWLAELG